MKIKIEIDCDNAAFEDYPEGELCYILKHLARKVKFVNSLQDIPLLDSNGNSVGSFTVSK